MRKSKGGFIMFEVALLYPDKQQGAAKRYGMPQDMGKDLNLSVILRAMAKEDEEIFTNCPFMPGDG